MEVFEGIIRNLDFILEQWETINVSPLGEACHICMWRRWKKELSWKGYKPVSGISATDGGVPRGGSERGEKREDSRYP